MITKLIFTIGLFCTTTQLFSQENESKFSLNIGGGANYYFTNYESPLKSHFGIGGYIDFVLKDKWVISYFQHSSLSKDGLLKNKETKKDHLSLFEHSLGFGFKIPTNTGFYIIPKANYGIGILKIKENYQTDWEEIKDEFSSDLEESYFVAPEIKIGYEFGKYIALETHFIYRYYFDFFDIPSRDITGLGVGLSIFGRIPF